MTFEEYQQNTAKTAIYPEQGKIGGLVYTALGLSGEVGETCNQIKKILRDNNGLLTDERKKKLFDELSDIGWYWSQLCTELGFNLVDIATYNLEKLDKRYKENKIHGDGDR